MPLTWDREPLEDMDDLLGEETPPTENDDELIAQIIAHDIAAMGAVFMDPGDDDDNDEDFDDDFSDTFDDDDEDDDWDDGEEEEEEEEEDGYGDEAATDPDGTVMVIVFSPFWPERAF